MGDALNQVWQGLWNGFVKDGLVIIIACAAIGWIVKHKTKIKNDTIPIICGIVGAVLAIVIPEMYAEDSNILAIIKGLAMGVASTGIHQIGRSIVNLKFKEVQAQIPDYEKYKNEI